MALTPFQLFVLAIPETLALTCLMAVLIGLPIGIRRAGLIAVISGVSVYLIRMLPVPFGVHSVILILILAGTFTALTRTRLSTALKTSVLAVAVLLVLEQTCFILYNALFNLDPLSLDRAGLVWSLLGIPHILAMFLLTVILSRVLNRQHSDKIRSAMQWLFNNSR